MENDLTAQAIKEAIAKVFEVKVEFILGRSRYADLVQARHILIYMLVHELGLHCRRVARMVRRDRKLVSYVMTGFRARLDNDTDFARRYRRVRRELGMGVIQND